jgi:uncharacterized protein (TIGR00288 family)
MQEKLNIAVFVDYDNIEIGVKSTLRREFDVSLVLEALKERGDLVAKFAYANWSRQEGATRQMAENAVQMVQRIPSPRGDKNGADINLALDALEMAFTHDHVNAFAIISGDSDFIPLVNKLKEYGKTVFVVGGKAFTSTILQQNCHEFISVESMLNLEQQQQTEAPAAAQGPQPEGERSREAGDRGGDRDRGRRRDRDERRRDREERRQQDPPRDPNAAQQPRPPALDLELSMPLVERALQVLQRRNVQPQLGLLKSTMLQLDPAFTESAYGARSFSEFIDKLKRAELVNVKGTGGRYYIERRGGPSFKDKPAPRPDEALSQLRDVLEVHRLEFEEAGQREADLEAWMAEEHPGFDFKQYGFQGYAEFLNFAQDKTIVRLEPDPESGLLVFLGAEFYPPALPARQEGEQEVLSEHDLKQPVVRGQPTATGEIPPVDEPPAKTARKRVARKKPSEGSSSISKPRRAPARRKKVE